MSDNQRERQLITQAIAGDKEAFGRLYELYLSPIFRFIRLRVDAMADAEDLTEQVFFKAWQALPGYRDHGHPFSSWLYRIAQNLLTDFHRKNQRQAEAQWLPQPEATHDALGELILTEESEALLAAFRKLPSVQQQVLLLRFVEGMAYEEVAAVVGKSSGACRNIQYRALAALNALMETGRVIES